MEIKIKNLESNLVNLMRRCGYQFYSDNNGEQSFVRSVGARDFPRFHAYLKTDGESTTISLHLDQRRPVYSGATAHGGDYDGPVVEGEANRIQSLINQI
jgi:hypothetical protein